MNKKELKQHRESISKSTWRKYKNICKAITEKKRILVALSGGVDSALLAQIATSSLGSNAVAVTIDTDFLSKRERDTAKMIAKKIGVRHIMKPAPFLMDTISKNPSSRCYQCKKHMAKILWETAQDEKIDIIADGVTGEDIKNPLYIGVKAWTEENIWHPLAEENFTKKEIRELARKIGLIIWDKPPESCLCTRIPHGSSITSKKLEMIEQAEVFLKQTYRQVRVRTHGDLARIEVHPHDLIRVMKDRKKISSVLHKLGFTYITLDLEGYRTGNMSKSSPDLNKKIL